MKAGRSTVIFLLRAVVVLVFGTALFARCANIVMPEGGPRDTLPPKVMGAVPAFNTTNFTGNRVVVSFDEYIQVKDQQKEFFTSPKMKKNPTILVKGRTVQVDIKDTLLDNTTYTLNFGSSVRDNNEGNPLNGFRYVFSTGPEIDSMIVSGYTVDAYKKDTVSKTLIFFYDAVADTLNQPDSTIFNVLPRAVARAETNGNFIAQNLKPIDYRVYAIEDNNGNFTYEPGTDRVGFLDSIYNPVNLPDFSAWYDTTRHFMLAEPQLYFRMFMDEPFKRQNLTSQTRPVQHKIQLTFGAPFPQIDSLTLFDIDSTQIITEYAVPTRDTINLWLNVPGEELPDTIKGRIAYVRHDSINQLVQHGQDLRLVWKYIETKEERREREKQEKDRERALEEGEEYEEPVLPNTFKYSFNVTSELNPENHLVMRFDYPLVQMDSMAISLSRLAEEEKQYKVRYSLVQDTLDMHKWIISAPWGNGQKYKFEAPAGVFRNVAGEQNDSIRTEFTVISPDKYGMVIVDLIGKSDSSLYVLQMLDMSNNVLQEKKYATTGKHTFNYITPGDIKFRIVEDTNGNGKWDTGMLLERRQPERVEIYMTETGDALSVRANWEMELTMDMNVMFKPESIEEVRRQWRAVEDIRYRKYMEEVTKKRQEKDGNKNQQQQNVSLPGGYQSAS